MSKKKKRSQALSDLLDNKKNYGNTTPHGPAARGKTHKGGNSMGTCTQGSISTPVTGQSTTGQPATGHSPNGQEDITVRPLVMTGHGSLATGQMDTMEFSSLSIISHRPSSHQSFDLERFNTGESQYSPATSRWSTGHRSSDFISTYS